MTGASMPNIALVFWEDSPNRPWAAVHGFTGACSLTIGRGSDCDIRVPRALSPDRRSSVSRLHARIVHRDGSFWIEDLDSNNFTFLNGQIVLGPERLTFPSQVRFGLFESMVDCSEAGEASVLPVPESDTTCSATITVRDFPQPAATTALRTLTEFSKRNVRLAAAILETSAILSSKLCVEEIESRLSGLLTIHLGRNSAVVALDVEVEQDRATGIRHRFGDEIDKSLLDLLNAPPPEPGTQYRSFERSGKDVWIVWSSIASPSRVSVVVADAHPPVGQRREQPTDFSIVESVIRLTVPFIRMQRRLECRHGVVPSAVTREPSDRMAAVCRRVGLIGNSAAFRSCMYKAEIAASRYLHLTEPRNRIGCVFISGETGTGKSTLARIIHELSDRSNNPFIELNCAGIPNDLAESELYGFERGAHATAFTAKPGYFEAVQNGTLFLDEIGKTGTAFQAKLLKVLDTGNFSRLGATRSHQTSCHVFLAASEEPEGLIRAAKLLPELWYRAGAFTIRVPALRERRDDVALLLAAELNRLNMAHEPQVPKRISDVAMALLQAHTWPGNVRELLTCMGVAYSLAEHGDLIDTEHFPDSIWSPPATSLGDTTEATINGKSFDDFMQTQERIYLATLVGRCGGNLSEVARRAGRSYPALHARIQSLRHWVAENRGPANAREIATLRNLAGSHWKLIDKPS